MHKITLLVGEELCRVIIRSSDMAYEDSDYTFMIAIMHCPNHTILVLKLTLVVEIQALLLCRRLPLLDHSLRHWLPVQPYEGPTKILTTQPSSLSFTDAETHRDGVVSAVISYCLSFERHCQLNRPNVVFT